MLKRTIVTTVCAGQLFLGTGCKRQSESGLKYEEGPAPAGEEPYCDEIPDGIKITYMGEERFELSSDDRYRLNWAQAYFDSESHVLGRVKKWHGKVRLESDKLFQPRQKVYLNQGDTGKIVFAGPRILSSNCKLKWALEDAPNNPTVTIEIQEIGISRENYGTPTVEELFHATKFCVHTAGNPCAKGGPDHSSQIN